MDTPTQMLLGAAIGEAGFSRRLGGRAVLFGAGMGLLPDLDLVSSMLGEWTSLVHHRGWSHSLLVLTLITPLMGYLGYRLGKRRTPYAAWTLLAFLALITHPLLDVCTSYGTMILVPITWKRFAIDAVGIIDPAYSLPLLASLVWSWRLRKRGASGRITGHRIAAAALALTTTFLLAGLGITELTRSRARSDLAAQGFAVDEIRATPPPLFTPLRRVVARDADGTVMVAVVSLWSPRPYRFLRVDQPDDPLIDKALATREGEIFTWFADGFITARVERDASDGTAVVHVDDHRYGLVTQPGWAPFGVRFEYLSEDDPPEAILKEHHAGLDVTSEIAASWKLMFGN
ncbi:MAG: metal-dependent hydrolase [Deltaproteobacteria bacterium]|nr:metal-dependent hydrolase [Deltaproteobacteria bacterium]